MIMSGTTKTETNFPFEDDATVVERSRSFYYPGGQHGVLLVHGFAGTIDGQRALGKFLVTKGFTVLGLRLPGHGISAEALATTDAEDWSRSVTEAVNWLRQKCTTISVIGASLGGNLALCHEADHHDLDKIVLLATPLRVHGQWWQQVVIPLILPFKKYAKKSWVKSDEERQRRLETGSYLSVSLRAFLSAISVFKRTRYILPQVHIPVLLVYSKYDEVINPRSAQWLFKHLASKHKKLLWVTTTDHHPHESEKRDDIFKHIHNFLLSNNV